MQRNLFGETIVDESIAILREFEPPEGYYGAFSGGKDSVVIKRLVELAGVKCDWHYQVTTLDPPPVLEFIRDHHPDVRWEKPKKSFCRYIKEGWGLPSMRERWCCSELKEVGGVGRIVVTGVRAAEGKRRSRYGIVTPCQKLHKTFVAPILRWTAQDIWQFIRSEGIAYCKLYDEGWTRVGCCFCPFATERQIRMALEAWPRMASRILEACRYAWEHFPADMQVSKRIHASPEQWFASYLRRDWRHDVPDDQEQFPLDQFDDEEDADE